MLPSPILLSSERDELKPSTRTQVLALPSSARAVPAAPARASTVSRTRRLMLRALQVARREELVVELAIERDALHLIQRLVAGLVIHHLAALGDPALRRRLDLLYVGGVLGLQQLAGQIVVLDLALDM